MPPRRLLVLVALVGALLVVAIGVSRASYPTAEGQVRCPERVWSSAIEGLADQQRDPCAAQSQERLFAVAAGVMGLVLVSGLLSRRG